MDDDILIIPVLIYPEDGQYWAQSMLFRDFKTSGPTASAALEGMGWAVFADLGLIIDECGGAVDMRSAFTRRRANTESWERFATAQINYFEDLLTHGRSYFDDRPKRDSIAFLRIPLGPLYDHIDEQFASDCAEDEDDDVRAETAAPASLIEAMASEAPPFESRRSLRLSGYPKDTKGNKKPN